MRRFGLYIVLISLPVHMVYSECTEEDLGKIKRGCKRSGLNFDMAETVENRTLVCDCLEELFKCINRTVPNCVDTMKDKYLAFSFTPWDCHLLEHYTTGDDKCGNDVIFEVRFKKEADETDIIQPDDDYDIEGSSDSCKIDAAISTPYITFLVLFLILWFHP